MARALLAALLASGSFFLIAATPAPVTSPPPAFANKLTKEQMQALLPKVKLHASYVVATNKLGQVTGAKPKDQSKDAPFNTQTYGNALQAFIRTEDGKAVPGVYTLSYDYDPKTGHIKRTVALVHAGGVDPDAEGAALVMLDAAKKEADAIAKAKHASPVPLPSLLP